MRCEQLNRKEQHLHDANDVQNPLKIAIYLTGISWPYRLQAITDPSVQRCGIQISNSSISKLQPSSFPRPLLGWHEWEKECRKKTFQVFKVMESKWYIKNNPEPQMICNNSYTISRIIINYQKDTAFEPECLGGVDALNKPWNTLQVLDVFLKITLHSQNHCKHWLRVAYCFQ